MRLARIADLLAQTRTAFREKFGRDPEPGDPLFFDPDADVPQELSAEKIEDTWKDLCDHAASQGIPPELVHAMRKTGRVVTEQNMHLLEPDELAEWQDAVDEYRRLD